MRSLLVILLLAGCGEDEWTPAWSATSWTQDAKPEREATTCIIRKNDKPKFCTVSVFEYDGHVCVRWHGSDAMECWEKGGP